jgi:hypothetical protein
MTDNEDRVRRLDVAGAQSPMPARPSSGKVSGRPRARAVPAKPWSNVIDSWVRDAKIRRDALIALALLLVASVAIVCAIAGVLDPLAGAAAGSRGVRIAATGLLGGGGLAYGGMRLRRWRQARRGTPPTHTQDEHDVHQRRGA